MTENPTLPHQNTPTEEGVQPVQEPTPTDPPLTAKHIKYAQRFLNFIGFVGAIVAGNYFRRNDYGQLIFAPVDTWEFWISIGALLASLLFFGLSKFFGDLKPDEVEESQARVQVAEEQLEASLAQRSATQEPADRDRSQLALANLWSVTHARLHQYHKIALGQAEKSFRNAQRSMLIGFALLVGFTILALKAESTAASAAAAVLGSASAALAGFVSRTFIRSQEAAATHLQRYFDQPLEFSRYLAAERLIADSNLNNEQRAEILSVLVRAMISGPPDPQATAGTANLNSAAESQP